MHWTNFFKNGFGIRFPLPRKSIRITLKLFAHKSIKLQQHKTDIKPYNLPLPEFFLFPYCFLFIAAFVPQSGISQWLFGKAISSPLSFDIT